MVHGILLAAGQSTRTGDINKLTATLGSLPVWEHALRALIYHETIADVTVVTNEDIAHDITEKYPDVTVVGGGDSRFTSLIHGIETVKNSLGEQDILIVHNAANPHVSASEIDDVIEGARMYGASGVGERVASTIKVVANDRVHRSLDRSELFAMQTPQALTWKVCKDGLEAIAIGHATGKGLIPTDELMIAEQAGVQPKVIEHAGLNTKITTAADLERSQAMFDKSSAFRMGIGEDSHRFSEEGELILGGITFSEHPQLHANSDGDVVLHALVNALSSAIGGGSISIYADSLCESGVIDSSEYVRAVLKKVRASGFAIQNVSISIEGARPKIEPRSGEMKAAIADILGISPQQIGITATSGEKLTSFGNGEGIRCTALVTLM